jgi:hypothetical protein
MFGKLNFVYLIIAFCIGIGYIYFVTPPPEIVRKFPSPFNTDSVVYTDSSKNCYKYSHEEVNCNTSSEKVLPQPVVENYK